MTKRIRIIEDGKEKLITIDSTLQRYLDKRETFEVSLNLRQNRTIVLSEYPITLSESVYINGLYMTEGSDYDYVINYPSKTITFNDLVVPIKGHITIVYKYLNSEV